MSLTKIRQELQEELKDIEEKQKKLEDQARSLREALLALGKKRSEHVRRSFKGSRTSKKDRMEQILEIMKQDPERNYSASFFKRNYGIPSSSSHAAIEELINEGKVMQIGRTTRGAPVIKLKFAAKAAP